MTNPEKTYANFIANCAQQDIGLPAVFSEPLHDDDVFPYVCYSPNSWFRAVAAAGVTIASQPGRPLVAAPVPDDFIDQTSTPQKALQRILNASVESVDASNQAVSFPSTLEYTPPLDVCKRAEPYFEITARRLLSGTYGGWRIITDGENPVAITKKTGELTTLALEEVCIQGIPYPAGSILNAQPERHIVGEVGGDMDTSKITVPIEDITNSLFLRMSVFGLSPRERADNKLGPIAKNPMYSRSLEGFRTAARIGMAHSIPAIYQKA